ncbi:hypothetical protein [Ideonella sp.]|uniref:hypothetical protein n=1 Tax=Ideonella sp. TaxID=1929293 RepID=UPI0035B21555
MPGQFDPFTLDALDLRRTGEVDAYCNRAFTSPGVIGAMIESAPGRGVQVRRLHWESLPEAQVPEPAQMVELMRQLSGTRPGAEPRALEGVAATAARKLRAFADERKARTGFLFVDDERRRWLLLYAGLRDHHPSASQFEFRENHWSGYGPHSHLLHWKKLGGSHEAIAQAFESGAKLPSGRHVRHFNPEWGAHFRQRWDPTNRP